MISAHYIILFSIIWLLQLLKSYFVACIIYIYSKFIKNYAMANPNAYMFWSFHPNILIKIFENQKEKHRFLHMHYYFIFQCINKFRMLICQSILIIVFKLLNLWNKKWSLNKVHIFFNSFFNKNSNKMFKSLTLNLFLKKSRIFL